MGESGFMSCGVILLNGFNAFYQGSAEELKARVRYARGDNKLISMTITDTALRQQLLVDTLRDLGFEQVCRWENRTHPARSGGVMLNLFILRPVVQVQVDHPRPAKLNWLDKRRRTKKGK